MKGYSMPSSVIVRARVDERLKQEAEPLLAAIGLTMSDAFRLLLLRIAQDKALPFEPIFPKPKPIKKKERDMSRIITPQMRHHAAVRIHDHFGFSGYRAAIACLYARPEGASQVEANEAAVELGSPQKGYLNMLRQAKKWGHSVVTWDDSPRGGKIYKLNFNPNHGAPHAVDPPPNWKELNIPKTPRGIKPAPYRPRSGN